jgi:hypothetical protein
VVRSLRRQQWRALAGGFVRDVKPHALGLVRPCLGRLGHGRVRSIARAAASLGHRGVPLLLLLLGLLLLGRSLLPLLRLLLLAPGVAAALGAAALPQGVHKVCQQRVDLERLDVEDLGVGRWVVIEGEGECLWVEGPRGDRNKEQAGRP